MSSSEIAVLIPSPEQEGDYGLDDDYDYDDEGIYDSSDEEVEGVAEGETSPRPKKKLGAWKEKLAAISQPTIPEDMLHYVRWESVLKKFAVNLSVPALFVGFTILAKLPMSASLCLFIPTWLSAVILTEYIMNASIRTTLICVILVLAGSTAGCAMLGLGFLSNACRFGGLLLGGTVLILRMSDGDANRKMHESSCYRALSGSRYVRLSQETDLAQLGKSLMYHAETAFPRLCWGSTSCIRLSIVRVDNGQADIPDITLTLSGVEIDPDQYLLTDLMPVLNGSKVAGQESFPFPIKGLEMLLKHRKCLSDRLLDGWFKPIEDVAVKRTESTASEQKAEPQDKDGEEAKESKKTGPAPTEKLRKWFNMNKLAPAGNCVLMARLRRTDYMKGLFEHWAICAAWAVVMCCMLALPAVSALSQMQAFQQAHCEGETTPDALMFGDVLLCGPSVPQHPHCRDVCNSLMNFGLAVHDEVGIGYLELALPFIFLPVWLFHLSVQMAQAEHNQEESIYFRRLAEPKKAVNEVLSLKASLEEVFRFRGLVTLFANSVRAWLGADSALSACGPITDAEFELTAKQGYNDCLRKVMKPVTEIQCSISAEASDPLPYGIGIPESGEEDDQDSALELEQFIKDSWKMLKFRNGLSGDQRNYKVMFDIELSSSDTWKAFKDWCKEGAYKEQFKYCCERSGAQDSGRGSHLTQDSLFCDILVPRGFSLTHVYVQAMPEDGAPFQIEVSGEGQDGASNFWSQCAALEKSLTAKTDDDDDDTSFEARIGMYSIVVRLAISEQYWQNMSTADVSQLIDSGVAPSSFTAFVDSVLMPRKFKMPEEGSFATMTAFSVFMGDEDPFHSMLAAFRQVMRSLLVYMQCLALAFALPLFRKLMGGSLFPAPISFLLVCNALSAWLQLSEFFAYFHQATTRLKLIAECLGLLETKTLEPSSRKAGAETEAAPGAETEAAPSPQEAGQTQTTADGTAPTQGQGAAQTDAAQADAAQAAQARAQKKAETETNPFDLFVLEDTRTVSKYDPTDPFWQAQFREKHANLKNWHMAVGYLRVFVSTSRLTAQSMLVAAAFIIGFLLLMSLAQIAHGEGFVDADHLVDSVKAGAGRRLEEAADAGHLAARQLQEEMLQVSSSMVHRSLLEVTAAAASASVLAEEPLAAAAEGLRAVLQPMRRALHLPLKRQHNILMEVHSLLQDESHVAPRRLAEEEKDSLGMGMDEIMDMDIDMTKVTKTQLFSMVMVVLVLIYSVPLMWNIVLVNSYFDRHEDLLVKQKESHRFSQDRREMKEGEAAETPDTDTSTTPAVNKDLSRYEGLLSTATESARKTRERFPLKLFGFVISGQLLATWVALAIAPVADQTKQVAPTLLSYACKKVTTSDWLDSLQDKIHSNTKGKTLRGIKLGALIEENICKPLEKMAKKKVNSLHLTEKAQAAVVHQTERRLRVEVPQIGRAHV
eukprot:TRINITY_DN5029_c0_g1_i2.p1 TRINITY_DN5029_c0_g1~~TRINITY_DN5029_c0_g1_i2.p1  ORF type:complete len:1449 (-),score=308.23 TRINITY_DN5029_c0_g1_i2:54-4400(-)